jgi:hypothetical protein
MRGYIYILINLGYSHLVKIGRSFDHPSKRAAQLSSTGVPHPFFVIYWEFVSDCIQVERLVHEAFSDRRENERREFFTVEPRDAIIKIQEISKSFLAPEGDKEGYDIEEIYIEAARSELEIDGWDDEESEDVWACSGGRDEGGDEGKELENSTDASYFIPRDLLLKTAVSLRDRVSKIFPASGKYFYIARVAHGARLGFTDLSLDDLLEKIANLYENAAINFYLEISNINAIRSKVLEVCGLPEDDGTWPHLKKDQRIDIISYVEKTNKKPNKKWRPGKNYDHFSGI